jgi:hypothetical protein
MNVKEIKQAVDKGLTVKWANDLYDVVKGKDDYYIICSSNSHCIGLTHKDGITLNGEESKFYIKRLIINH